MFAGGTHVDGDSVSVKKKKIIKLKKMFNIFKKIKQKI